MILRKLIFRNCTVNHDIVLTFVNILGSQVFGKHNMYPKT